jgi:hypothetical protein
MTDARISVCPLPADGSLRQSSVHCRPSGERGGVITRSVGSDDRSPGSAECV